jgi:diacylglycerol kinase (ATP)
VKSLSREWERLINRIVWSQAGWRFAWSSEPSLKFWTVMNVASAALALSLPLEPAERALILMAGIMVLAAELLNTAIERVVDYISTDLHPMTGQAKDNGSAGVAVTAIAVGVAWIVVLIG